MMIPYDIAQDLLLKPADLTEQQLLKILSGLLGGAIDAADLYFQTSYQESWSLEDGIVKVGSYHFDRGVGVRAMSQEKTGFAYSDDIHFAALSEAANAAGSIVKHGGQGIIKKDQSITVPTLYPAINPLKSLDKAAKIALLEKVDREARRYDPRVTQVNASLSGSYEVILIVASDGTFIPDVRPLVRMNVSVVVEQGNKRESAAAGGGGRVDYHYFTEEERALQYAREAVRQAVMNLDAEPAPAGMMPVVLGPGWPGVLLHEAVGHGLEGDFNRKGLSAFSGRIGERVAAPGVTVVDDGTLPGRRGSLNVDDEGTPTQCTVLIEDGYLKGYMQDKLNARLMGMQPTGNARRESFSCVPMPRMTNTYMRAGKYSPEEIISTVERGIYAVNFGGGQVDITSGQFVFSASEAYLIEKGKVVKPVKGATLIGNGPDIMQKISMIGNDLRLDSGVGVCGKEGQSVPVGVGQPTLKIDAITIGGTHNPL